MSIVLTGCGNTVVTGRTVINDSLVIKYRRGEGTRYVAYRTIFDCWHVSLVLANRATGTTVVTGIAAFADDFGTTMVDKGIGEINRVMTDTTIFGSTLMDRGIGRTSGTERDITGVTTMAG